MTKKGMFDLTGKKVLVTGGGSGIGRAYCEAMAEFGADVACCDILEDRAGETVDIIIKHGHSAVSLAEDVFQPEGVDRILQETVEKLGGLDIVFANAGVGEGARSRIHQKRIEDWDRIMNANLRSVFLLMRSAFPIMLEQKSGVFISTASVGGFWPVTIPMSVGYAVAKSGVIMLTKSAARQYADDGIRVNAICPGWTSTNLHSPEAKERINDIVQERVPMKRVGQPSDLKGLAVWLASDASSFVTGQAFVADGGEIA